MKNLKSILFIQLLLGIILIFSSSIFGQTIKITTASCSGLGSITTLNYAIYAEPLSGALDYQFKFEEVGGAGQIIEVKKSVVGPTRSNALNLTKVTAFKYNTTYKVYVRATTDGTFDTESYGSYCTFTTPILSTNVMATSCTILNSMTSFNTVIYADPIIDALDYQFKFEEVGGTNQIIEIKKSILGPTTSNALSLLKVTALKYNTPYKVYVRATLDGIFDSEQYGTYCSFTTPSLTPIKIATASCTAMGSISTFNTIIYSEPLGGATDYQFKFEEVGGAGQIIEIKKSVIGPTTSNALNLLTVSSLKYNTPYRVYVRATIDGSFTEQAYGSFCTFTTPLLTPIKITTTSCDLLSTITSLNTDIYAEPVVGAIDYQFKFEDGENPAIEVRKSVVGPTTSNALNLLKVTGIQYYKTYFVSVKATIDGTFTDQDYGSSCMFTTPALSTIKIKTSSCSALNTITTLNTVIYAEQVAGATDYQFKFEEIGGSGQIIEVKKSVVGPTTSNALRLSLVAGLKINRPYRVYVKATLNGLFNDQAYGDYCTFTTPPQPYTKITDASCAALSTITTLRMGIDCDPILGATDYKFKFVEVGGSGQIIEVTKSTLATSVAQCNWTIMYDPSLCNLYFVPGIKYNTMYKVYAKGTVDGTFDDANYRDYCTFTTPQPNTWLTDGSCNELQTTETLDMVVTCEPIIGATDYQFKFEEVGGAGQIIELKKSAVGPTSSHELSLLRVPGIKYNTQYNVYIRSTFDGVFDGVGFNNEEIYNLTPCTFTSPAILTKIENASCNSLSNISTLNKVILAADVIGALDYQFKFEEIGGVNQVIEIKKSVVGPTTSSALSLLKVTGIKYNTPYKIFVRATLDGIFDTEVYSDYCSFTTPILTTNITSSSCTSLGSIITLNTVIYAEQIVGALDYEFKFEEVGGTNQIIEVKKSVVGPTTSNALSLTKVTGLQYNTPYKIFVRATLDGIFDTEEYSDYCSFTTPILTTNITSSSCTSLGSIITLNTVIYAEQIIGALDYEFKFEEIGGTNQIIEVKKSVVGPNTSNALSLTKVTGLKLSTPYNIYVKATLDGTFDTETYGSSCSFTTPSTAKNENTTKSFVETKANDLKFEIIAYPNPFNGETNITIQSLDLQNINIFVLDLSGRIVESFPTTTNKVNTIGQSLLKGIYILKVIDSKGNFQVVKLIKN